MTKKNGTKRSLLMSAVALVLCFSMLVGSTFAWFTDSVTSSGNIIASGKLDVEMMWKDATATGAQKTYVDASLGAIFNYDLWEPGYVEAKNIQIKNAGTLALKYQLNIVADGEASDLTDAIDVYYVDGETVMSNRADMSALTLLGTLTEVLAGMTTTASGNLEAGKDHTITLALKMRESAGNEYMDKSIGSSFAVKLVATQLEAEADSFDKTYDKMATIDTEEELTEALAADYDLIQLGANIALADTVTIPAGKTVAIDLMGYTMSQTKDCTENYSMITNNGTLTIEDSIGSGKVSFTDTGAGDPTFGWGSYTIRNNGTLVIDGGMIEHLGTQERGKHLALPIWNYSGSTTINGGTISCPNFRSIRLWSGEVVINGGEFIGQVGIQCVDDTGKMTINGGSFAPAGVDGSSVFVNNRVYDAELNITGGYFATKVGADDADALAGGITGGTYTDAAINGGATKNLIADGYKAANNGDGTYTVVNVKAAEVNVYGLTLKPNGDNSQIIVNDKEGFLNLTKLFNNWTALLTDGNGNAYSNYVNGAGADYYYGGRWTICLEADIDLNNATIDPVTIVFPTSTGTLTFDGKGHTISNAKIVTDATTENEAGLFNVSYVAFKDLKLDNIQVAGSNVDNSTAGVLSGTCNAPVSNITVTNSSVTNGKYTGGVVGYGYTNVTDCTVENTVVKGGYKVGGIIGFVDSSSDGQVVTGNALTDCTVDGVGGGVYADGKTTYVVGKVIGHSNCNITISNNVVTNMTTSATAEIGLASKTVTQ